jgi:uncharacterized protein with ParB-like and HNH nuclease domain
MAKNLDSLSKLYEKRLFRIPDYQRGYAWKVEQLKDFWDDLINLRENQYHYTGLLSLKEVFKEESVTWSGYEWLTEIGYTPYHIVDGQQRLTTFSILLFVIISYMRKLYPNVHDEQIILGKVRLNSVIEQYLFKVDPTESLVKTYLFGYETDDRSTDYLKYKIFEEDAAPTITETYYTHNLKNAKAFFEANIDTLYQSDGVKGIELLFKKLTQQLMFNLHEIEDDYDVFIAFETMNNRGKRLTNLELLKNRLIYLTTLFDDKQLSPKGKVQLRKDINETWREIYFQLGRNSKYLLSDDEYLKHHWLMYFQYSRNTSNAYIKFLLTEKFTAKNILKKQSVIHGDTDFEPLSDIEPNEDDNEVIQDSPSTNMNASLKKEEIEAYIKSLKSMAKYWYYSYFPYGSEVGDYTNEEKDWVDKLIRIGIANFRPLVAVALSLPVYAAERVMLFKAIERFIFIVYRTDYAQSNYKSSVYYRKAKELLDGTDTISGVVKSLKETTDGELSAAIKTFIAKSNKRYDDGDGFYGWGGIKYFLFEYESNLALEKKRAPKVSWENFSRYESDKTTIEHILPQKSTKEYWLKKFSQCNEQQLKLLAGSLGNLLPLAQSINSSFQNDEYPDKRNGVKGSNGEIKRTGYFEGSFSEIEVADKYPDWSPEDILQRGQKLLEFMCKRWAFTLTDSQKDELLYIRKVGEKLLIGRPNE